MIYVVNFTLTQLVKTLDSWSRDLKVQISVSLYIHIDQDLHKTLFSIKIKPNNYSAGWENPTSMKLESNKT